MRLAAIGFFPATPDAARVLYSDELMRFTSVYMAGGVRMVESLGKALVDFHVANGCVRAKMTRYGETWALQLSSGSSWKLPPGPSAGGPTAHSQHALKPADVSHGKKRTTFGVLLAQLDAAQQLFMLVDPQSLHLFTCRRA